MSTGLRELLENAKGTTEHIIALVMDIRGFTPFCQANDSWDVANFIKRVYIKVIDDYFPKASFYKPTGDGLLIVIPFKEESRKDIVANTMESCFRLLQNFEKLREGDDMINFPTPDKIGIGMSRGTACCITSNGAIIDYSGKVVNLASRLNDFARPNGIVFDSALGLSLLPEQTQKLFLSEKVYVRGIAEDKPITIYFTKQHTLIPPSRKEPLKEPKWSVITTEDTYGELMKCYSSKIKFYSIELESKPLDEKQIVLIIYHVLDRSARREFILGMTSRGVHYVAKGLIYRVQIDFPVLIKELRDKLKDDDLVHFEVNYPVG
jgi:class 3 adenylate cyclase